MEEGELRRRYSNMQIKIYTLNDQRLAVRIINDYNFVEIYTRQIQECFKKRNQYHEKLEKIVREKWKKEN